WDGKPPPIYSVPCGIETDIFSPTSTDHLSSKLSLGRSELYLLFPHRPDPNKGFETALKTLKQLYQIGKDYKLLIPVSPTASSDPNDSKYYAALRSQAEQLGVGQSVIFHEWIHQNDLPAYFSLGNWCLVLSEVPEGFGLTPAQSVS